MENTRIGRGYISPLVLSGLAVDDAVGMIDERSFSTTPRILMLSRSLSRSLPRNLPRSLNLTDGILAFGTTGSWSLAIPNQSNWLGAQFSQQAFMFAPPHNSFGGAMPDAAAWQSDN